MESLTGIVRRLCTRDRCLGATHTRAENKVACLCSRAIRSAWNPNEVRTSSDLVDHLRRIRSSEQMAEGAIGLTAKGMIAELLREFHQLRTEALLSFNI